MHLKNAHSTLKCVHRGYHRYPASIAIHSSKILFPVIQSETSWVSSHHSPSLSLFIAKRGIEGILQDIAQR